MALSVIGAGFGRTGTESMKQALELIGFGPCHHMLEVHGHAGRTAAWRALITGGRPDWDQIFEGFGSTVDWPAAAYWRELARHYPAAKILLTVRDPESWHRSMEGTIFRVLRDVTEPESIGQKLIREQVFGGDIDDKAHVIATYERNIAELRAAFGPDRLLTYELGSGWEPLCRFLGCPVPEVPYPHTNTTSHFTDRVAVDKASPTAD